MEDKCPQTIKIDNNHLSQFPCRNRNQRYVRQTLELISLNQDFPFPPVEALERQQRVGKDGERKQNIQLTEPSQAKPSPGVKDLGDAHRSWRVS